MSECRSRAGMRVSYIAGASINPGVVIHVLERTHRALPQGELRFLKSLILPKTHPETNSRSEVPFLWVHSSFSKRIVSTLDGALE